jgi:hypothetical protein
MADAVVNGKIQPKRTKAMDMRFHWLRDRECQQQFKIYWRPGKLNYADYWTKHHSAAHHQNMRKEFLTPCIVLEMLRTLHVELESCQSHTWPDSVAQEAQANLHHRRDEQHLAHKVEQQLDYE